MIDNYSLKVKKVFVFLLLAVCLFALKPHQVSAQNIDNPWTNPVNLSRSGSTSEPRIVVDSNGVIHVIWVDAYAGTLYTQGDGERWSPPHSVSFPFNPLHPQFFADGNGQIHAFWIGAGGTLSFSSVKTTDFEDPSLWLPVKAMAESIVSMDLAIDTRNVLHLVYVRDNETVDYPAGVYYQRSINAGLIWSAPELLYQSPYFRGLKADQANLEITTSESNSSTNIFVAWDNRPRKQVLLIRSQDGGHNWGSPIQIAKPEANSELTDPFNIHVGASGDKVLLVWQDGEPITSCTQYYQWSTDGGNTWDKYPQMIKGINGCAQENRILSTSNDLFFIESTILEQVYLLAWNGSEWSAPQMQEVLNNFSDPETYNSVIFSCRQQIVQEKQGRLFVVGCDNSNAGNTGQSNQNVIGTGDIWFMSRPLGTASDWFPESLTWSSPAIIATSETGISSPILLVDNNERVHAFWKQLDSNTVALNGANSGPIFYSLFDDGNWSQPAQVKTFPVGEAQEPALTIDSQGRLLAVWSGGESGVLNYSEVDAGQVTSTSDWSTMQQVPTPLSIGSSPSISSDNFGTIYVTYAVPFNEGRGIYLNISKDRGKTWSEPLRVFDGAAAGWEMVGNPRLMLTSEGYLHLLWARSNIPAGSGNQILYYARSQDGGQTWSEIQEVVETRAVWSDLLGSIEGTIHRAWQEDNKGWSPIWDQYSLDNGATWSQATSISGIGDSLGLVALKVDSAGQYHLMQLASRSDGLFELQHWVWLDQSWSKGEGQDLVLNAVQKVTTLEAAISPAGKMSVLYIGSINNQKSNQLTYNLFYTAHAVDILSVSPKPTAIGSPISVETPLPTESPALTPMPELNITPTNSLTIAGSNELSTSSASLPNSWMGVILGAGIVIVIIGLLVGVTMLKARIYKK